VASESRDPPLDLIVGAMKDDAIITQTEHALACMSKLADSFLHLVASDTAELWHLRYLSGYELDRPR
jgi:hypothetical protein